MYCNCCGKVIQDDAVLCAYCGVRVAASVSRKRLVRPEANKQIAGVCAGLAEYFDVDVTLVRLAVLLTALLTGCGFIAYLVGWLVMPLEPIRSYVPPVPQGSQQTAGS
jgi:phage shock protein C